MKLGLQRYSYRLAEKTPNSKLAPRQEIEGVLLDPGIDIASLYRTNFDEVMQKASVTQGWQNQPAVFNEMESLSGEREGSVTWLACIVAQNS